MDHGRVAATVLEAVGGPENISAAAHCATRLRMVLVDSTKIDQNMLDNDADIKGTFSAGGMFQVIIGPGDVNHVYEKLTAAGVREVSKDEAKGVAAEKQNVFARFIKTIADIFVPILPALIAGGLMMSLNNVMTAQGLFGPKSLIELWPWLTDYAALIQLVASAAFAALPVLIGFSATKRFGGNPYLGAALGAAMISAELINAYAQVAALEAGTMAYWELFGLSVSQVGYQGQVIPMIAVAWLLATIEKWLHKRLKGTTDFLVTPLVTMILTGFLAFVVVGPIMRIVAGGITEGLLWLYTHGGPVGGFIFGLVYSPIVVTGLHQSFPAIELPLIADVATTGGSFILPIASMANAAQGAAALAIFLMIRNQKIKGLAGAASASAFFGITEPAIFGVNLRIRWAFFCGMIGSAFGSALVGLFDLRSMSLGSAGLLGFVAMVPKDIPLFFVALSTSIAISFGLTMFWGRTRGKADLVEGVQEVVEDFAAIDEAATVSAIIEGDDLPVGYATPAGEGGSVATAVLDKVEVSEQAGVITSPLHGIALPLSQVPDAGFASGAVGKGVAIYPIEGMVRSPGNGKVVMTFPTGHAIGLRLDSGAELLIHIGIDTVNMEGNGFTVHASKGDTVKAGDPLVSFDREAIEAAGYSPITPVLVTNHKRFADVEVAATGPIDFADPLLLVEAQQR